MWFNRFDFFSQLRERFPSNRTKNLDINPLAIEPTWT